MDHETKMGLLFGALILASFFGLGAMNIAKGETVADCMAAKGDMSSKIYYAECVKELG